MTLVSFVALAVSFVALVQAGDDGGGGGPAAPAGPATQIEVHAAEFKFAESSSTVAADTDVTVDLVNDGAVEHEWVVLAEGQEITDEADFSEGRVEVRIGPAAAGESASGSVNLPAGTYQVICAIAGHFAAGMETILEVQ